MQQPTFEPSCLSGDQCSTVEDAIAASGLVQVGRWAEMLAAEGGIMRHSLTVAGVLATLGIASATAVAAEICHASGGQYAETRTCVSSVLPPQGRNTYGPDKLGGNETGAWCEGVAGPGIGQSITLHQSPANVIGSMSFTNGYVRTPELYRANGRVQQARLETSGGYRKTITLRDTSEPQNIEIPPSKVSWVRLTVLAVYASTRGSDTCVSKFYFNQEDSVEEQQDK